jgi:hypothetical protein
MASQIDRPAMAKRNQLKGSTAFGLELELDLELELELVVELVVELVFH